jgi:hypothetical protein
VLSYIKEKSKLKEFEYRMLRRVFRPKWDEIIGRWRKQHYEKPHNLCSSPDIIKIIKSRRME